MEFDDISKNEINSFSAGKMRVQDNDEYMKILEHEEMLQLG